MNSELERWLRLFSVYKHLLQKDGVRFSALTGGSQPPLRPGSGDLLTSCGLCGLLHMVHIQTSSTYVHTQKKDRKQERKKDRKELTQLKEKQLGRNMYFKEQKIPEEDQK